MSIQSLLDQWCEIILLNKFLGNVHEFYVHIFRAIHWCLGVKSFFVKAEKALIMMRQDTVNHKLDQVDRTCGRAYIAGILDAASIYGDACTIGIFLLRSDLTHNHGVANFLPYVARGMF